ncbi:MAG: hypothetical protein ACHQ7N_06745 [Candidatus Methylomirabilales bacterium]
MAHVLTLARWKTALNGSGCPVCRLAQEAGHDFLIHVLREGKAHADVYERVREAGGFCEDHTRVLRRLGVERLGDRRSLARLYGWLLDDLASDRTPRGSCPACEAAMEYERVSLTALRDLLHPVTGDPDLRERFEQGEGLCLGHFVAAASLVEDGESLRILTDAQARSWDVLSRDLKEYLRKHDYRFSREPKTPAEEQSWIRAVATISGIPLEIAGHSSEEAHPLLVRMSELGGPPSPGLTWGAPGEQ